MRNVPRFQTSKQVPPVDLNEWLRKMEEKYCGGVLTDADRQAIHVRREEQRRADQQLLCRPEPLPRGESQHRAAARRRVGPHIAAKRLFEASAVWQYQLPSDGRKWFVACAHRQWLAQFLAGYPSIYMGTDYLTRQLRKSPGTFRKPDGRVLHLKWSLRTVKRTLADLRRLGVEEPCGRVGYRRPRLRKLRPEALHSEPLAVPANVQARESGTLTSLESGTREVPKSTTELPKKLQHRQTDSSHAQTASEPYRENHPSKPVQPTPEPQPPVELTPDNESIIRVLSALTFLYGPEEASLLLGWINERISRRKVGEQRIRTVGYFLRAAENFHAQNINTEWINDERYDFAAQCGYSFDGHAWQFDLCTLAEHDLLMRVTTDREAGRFWTGWDPTIGLLRIAARQHDLPWDNESLLAVVRRANAALGFTEVKAAA